MSKSSVRSISSAPSLTTRQDTGTVVPAHDHRVQFYENEHFLSAAVAEYLAEGIAAGQPVVVIATEAHCEAFSVRLRSRGIDIERARSSGELTLLDARETLSGFMTGAVPDPARFLATVGSVIEQRLGGRTQTPVRAYGEMVDVLWNDGNTDGAIRLEELWNELASTHSFSLLCAYAMGNFYKEAHASQFHEVCRQHSHVIPTERYTTGDEAARWREISTLQQRAQALEAEIEHRKELERRLRETLAARRRAEDTLRERERELSASLEREKAARADAEVANTAKSQFLAVMSHELRTPLNAIAGHVELVEMGVYGAVNDAQREALLRVQRSQRHLLSLINNVLNLARIETGRIEYSLAEISLAPLLHDVAAMVEPLFAAKQLTFEISDPSVDSPAVPVVVRADPEKVRQILLNLVTNAIKFTPAGGRVAVEAAPCVDAQAMACVRVRDTGIGIPEEKLSNIFEPFVQLAACPGSQRDGVGLGLAISRDLARGMGGDLTASSSTGQGATFTLRLPRPGR